MNNPNPTRTLLSRPLMLVAGTAALLATGACSENRPFERESASAQTRLAVPTSMTPPISVRGVDGAPDEWKLSERVAEALRSRDIPASAASRSRSAFMLKGEMRQGAQKNGRSRVEVVWSLYDGVGKKVGEVTQMAAVPGGAFKTPNEGVVEAMADAAAESIAPLVPSSSVQLADGTETGERKGSDRSKLEDRDRVTAVGKMQANTGVARNLLTPPPKREVKVEASTAPAKPGTRTAAAPPPAAKPQTAAPSTATPSTATRHSAAPPAAIAGDKKALTAVGRYEGASPLSRNLLRPDVDPSKPLPPPHRVKKEEPPRLIATPSAREAPPREPMDSEESLSLSAAPEPASDTGRRAPTRITPPQRAEAETPRSDIATPSERPRQIAESPAPRKEAPPERRPEARIEPKPVQHAERAGRAGYQYWIQVGAHKDEAVSRAEWQKIQSAAGGLAANAGNRIQRADLGARGVYYRVQVGPFASQGEAGQFCAQLKARNVDCFLAAPETTTASTRPPETQPNEEPARKASTPAPKPIAKPAEPKPVAKPTELKPVAKPAEPKPVAKPAEAKPVAKPVESKPAPAEKREAAMPKKPAEAEMPPPLPEQKPPRGASAEKPDAPISTAPGLPGVLD